MPSTASDAAETVSFSFENSSFEIELNETNAGELRGILVRYKAAGRKLSGPRTKQPRAITGVRQWAAENGVHVSPRGRVSGDILQR